MQNIYMDTRVLDRIIRERCSLSEDCMMENAAATLEAAVLPQLRNTAGACLYRPALLVLAGSGNNGADGYALARRLHSKALSVAVCSVLEAKSPLCILQKTRAEKLGVRIFPLYELDRYLEETSIDVKVIADCIFGSGFHGTLPPEAEAAIQAVAGEQAYRIACDIPSGLDALGNCTSCFMADETVTMGALKLALYSDVAKDACGTVRLADLGVSRTAFEQGDGTIRPAAMLLGKEDLRLPHRGTQNVHKGSFGHLAVVQGEKAGAAVLAAEAALHFGAGLVTLVQREHARRDVPWELMAATDFPEHTSAVAAGMGLGKTELRTTFFDYLVSRPALPAVLDADVFYMPELADLLGKRARGLVLTPHPKEFASLLAICGMGQFSVAEARERKRELVRLFCSRYPDTVLLLKGANVLIAQGGALYINTLGCNALAKGGSGDVLSGLIAALLAQGYGALDAACNASLAHAVASSSCGTADYALTPRALIEAVSAAGSRHEN